jgi:plasminogen activator inhibitor 1 RNA-binding protein
MTYKEWLDQNQKKSDSASLRQPDQSKWSATKELTSKKAREDDLPKEDPARTKSSSKKAPAKKVFVEIEQVFTPVRSEGRGGRGGSRGVPRGTGERGARGGGGRGRGRGGPVAAGTRGGARGQSAQTIDVADPDAFPALG